VIHPKHSLGKFVTESLTVQMDSEKWDILPRNVDKWE
jgi:hypothetical protein